MNILGVCARTHDSSSALIKNGAFIGFLEEDRLTGEKHTKGFPEKGITRLLDSANLSLDDIDIVAYTFDASLYDAGRQEATETVSDDKERNAKSIASYHAVELYHDETVAIIKAKFPDAKIIEVPHHYCHALSGIAPRGWKDCDILVIDSIGEGATISSGSYLSKTKDIKLEAINFDTDSLGYVYGAVTDHLGYKMRDSEGTVMALAALGDPSRFRNLFKEVVYYVDGKIKVNTSYIKKRVFMDSGDRLTNRFVDETFERRLVDGLLNQDHKDLAAALQERTTELILSLLGNGWREHELCVVVGGVATNCWAMGVAREKIYPDELYVPPCPGDGGTSLGAALYVELEMGKTVAVPYNPYWGVKIPMPSERELSELSAKPVLSTDEKIVKIISNSLAHGKIVGVLRDLPEAGPRALGHASIFASPQTSGVLDRLAIEIKKREPFRPFAPIITSDNASSLFNTMGCDCPYMSYAVKANSEAISSYPQIIHNNNTARLQTVKMDNVFLTDMLREFEKLTGGQIIINTSFNPKGKPTCGRWEDAITYSKEMGLDMLVLGNYIIDKKALHAK